MFALFDEDLDDMELVQGALALNHAIDPETQVFWAEQELERLLKEAELYLAHEMDEKQRLESFLRLFYHEWRFEGDSEAYFSSENVFIDKVLERKKRDSGQSGRSDPLSGEKTGFSSGGCRIPDSVPYQSMLVPRAPLLY